MARGGVAGSSSAPLTLAVRHSRLPPIHRPLARPGAVRELLTSPVWPNNTEQVAMVRTYCAAAAAMRWWLGCCAAAQLLSVHGGLISMYPLRHRRSCSQNFRRECSSERARNVPNTVSCDFDSRRKRSTAVNPVAVRLLASSLVPPVQLYSCTAVDLL